MALNKGQSIIVDDAVKWHKSLYKQTFEYSGPAGTGKTYVARAIMDRLGLTDDDVLFCTFMGKATLPLRLNGCKAYTIHSVFYELAEDFKTDDEGEIITELDRPVKILKFKERDQLLGKIPKLIFIDEGGSVSEELARAILKHNIPVIVMGDLHQLPPVFGKSGFLNNPDGYLTEIMRQAEGDPIIYLATLAREGKLNQYVFSKYENIRRKVIGSYGPRCHIIPKSIISDGMLKYSDIVIAGKNDTRHKINRYIRENIYGRTGRVPLKGEKLLCRKNNWMESIFGGDYNLVNGMIGYVRNEEPYIESIANSSILVDFIPDFSKTDYFDGVSIDLDYLHDTDKNKKDKMKYRYSQSNKFEFGYGITCHSAQGSQFPSVLYYNEYLHPSINTQALYTGITRAKDMLLLAI